MGAGARGDSRPPPGPAPATATICENPAACLALGVLHPNCVPNGLRQVQRVTVHPFAGDSLVAIVGHQMGVGGVLCNPGVLQQLITRGSVLCVLDEAPTEEVPELLAPAVGFPQGRHHARLIVDVHQQLGVFTAERRAPISQCDGNCAHTPNVTTVREEAPGVGHLWGHKTEIPQLDAGLPNGGHGTKVPQFDVINPAVEEVGRLDIQVHPTLGMYVS
mmetsp:Transcript_135322/g.234625  ORF Transcript_135322/g.234625 Transcript_135322/m.234625 type:complete len:218 (+) Transcript_135322:1184-1837(+)